MNLLRLLLLLLVPFNALAAEPFATATIDEGENLVTGQQVHLTVSVLAPDFFTSPPQFTLFELPNALVTLPEERAQNLVQTIDGVQYSGIRRRYAIVPEVPGTYTVPSIRIELGYSVAGKPVHAVATTQTVSFMVRDTARSQNEAAFAARNLRIEQAFDRDPASLKVGDALVRTFTVTAEDTQAILLPPVDVQQAPGLRQYTKSPTLDDGIPIGREMASRRIETIVYTGATEGHFNLPAVDYPWFDLDANSISSARLPSTQIEIAAAPARSGITPDMRPANQTSPFEERRRAMMVIGLFLAMACLLWAMRGLPGATASYLARVRARITTSRWYRLRRLRHTILSANLPEVYAALQGWSRSEGFRTLHAWTTARHPEFSADLDTLERGLYSDGNGNFDRRRVAAMIHGSPQSAKDVRLRHALPDLNPGTPSERPAFTRR